MKDESAIQEESLSADAVRRRAVAGVATVGARGLLIRGLGLAGTIVLAHLLTPRDFGLIALGFTIVSIGGFLATGGFGAALIRQKNPPSRETLEAVLGLQLVVALIVCAAVAAIGIALGGRPARSRPSWSSRCRSMRRALRPRSLSSGHSPIGRS